jgi:diaminohydroxyphosphoribosylaminopyrimidine deaminase/5-amino-6-(5-phosphoribosylamino)uracil reductase
LSLHLFDHSIPTLVFTEKQKPIEKNLEYITIEFKERMIENILHHLYNKGIQSVLVEGGTQLLQAFIDSLYWDEARIFTAPLFFKAGIPAPKLSGIETGRDNIGGDQLIILSNEV